MCTLTDLCDVIPLIDHQHFVSIEKPGHIFQPDQVVWSWPRHSEKYQSLIIPGMKNHKGFNIHIFITVKISDIISRFSFGQCRIFFPAMHAFWETCIWVLLSSTVYLPTIEEESPKQQEGDHESRGYRQGGGGGGGGGRDDVT